MTCAQCGFANEAEARFCGGCGAELSRLCAACEFANRPDRAYCGQCGQSLSAGAETSGSDQEERDTPPTSVAKDGSEIIQRFLPAQLSEKILASRGKIDGERKYVTVIFADIEGYTPLA